MLRTNRLESIRLNISDCPGYSTKLWLGHPSTVVDRAMIVLTGPILAVYYGIALLTEISRWMKLAEFRVDCPSLLAVWER